MSVAVCQIQAAEVNGLTFFTPELINHADEHDAERKTIAIVGWLLFFFWETDD